MATQHLKIADGRVESTPGGVVTGWAWIPSAPDERVKVSVWVNGRPVAEGVADQHAPGLAEVGIGDGHYAFAIQLPEAVAAEELPRVAVRVDGALGRLPMLAEWAQTGDEKPWASVRLIEDEGPLPPPPIDDDAPPPVPDPADFAMTGTNGWLFALSDSEAERLSKLRRTAAELQESASLLDQLGIRYVVAVLPSKLAVHPERGTVPTAGLPRCAPELEALARDHDSLEIFDLLPVLLDARRHGALFEPRSEVLSALGAFHVHRGLVKRAGPVGPGLRALPLTAIALAPTLERGEDALEGLPTLGDPAGERPPAPEGIDAAALRALRMPAGKHLEVEGLPAPRVYEQGDAAGLARAVLVGDPSIHSVAPWLAEAVSRLVVLSAARAPLVPIELEHPAVVFHLLDDRRLLA